MKKDTALNGTTAINEVFDATHIANIENETRLSFYPNPAADIITIIGVESSEKFTFTIYNIIGEIVQTGKTVNNNVNLKTLNTGVYFIDIPSLTKTPLKVTKI